MKDNYVIYSDDFIDIYSLYVKTFIGKLIKKGKKDKALKLYKNIKENIKLDTNKQDPHVICLLSLLNSMPKVSFKEIRLGSQKKEVPMPISEFKQVLVSVDSILKFSKKKKKLEFNRLISYIISSSNNEGVMITNKKIKYKKAIINRMLLNIFIPKKQN